MTDDNAQVCFFIAPIGEPNTPTRERSDRVLRHVVQAGVARFGYEAIRADAIAEPGIITSQVIERVVDSPLVIADLTGHNPNVFYELAIRHAFRKPYVQIIERGHTIPFDVSAARTIIFDLDLDGAANAADEVARYVESLHSDPSTLQTPISLALDFQNLRRSPDQDYSTMAQVLPLLTGINSAVNSNSNEIALLRENVSNRRRNEGVEWNIENHIAAVNSSNPYGFIASLGSMRSAYPWLHQIGVAAYTQVLAGNSAKGQAVFDQLIAFAESRFPSDSYFVSVVLAQLGNLFQRLVEHERTGYITDVDGLRF